MPPKRKRRSPARRTPVRTRRRRQLLVTIVAVAVVALGGGYVAGQEGLLDDWLDQVQAAPGEIGDDTDPERARQQLDALTVAEWESMSGYSRDRFPHWRTVDGCDARQTVLARDGDEIQTEEDSCRVVSGTWHSAFDGVTLTDPSDVDIDHLVPLAAAWRAGANSWDDDQRATFANDLDTPQLIAVSATSNRAKGDQDPSQWKPPERGYWCQYAHDWVTVKHHWELTVTEDERQALVDMLDTCPDASDSGDDEED